MNVKINDKITWKDKYGRLLPGKVTSIGKYDDMPELELNGCIGISAPTFLPMSKEWNNAIIDPFQIISIQN
tara:strand:- start:424 stop:636 length:213 start_codon:yes stop_codon:yes gene_type:complete